MNDDDPGPYPRKPLRLILALLALLGTLHTSAQEARGLTVSIDAGTLFADQHQAAFYSGRTENANTIYRVIHSEMYGYPMWCDLASQGLINTDVVGNYQQFTIDPDGYPLMAYRIAMQLGIGFRYDFGHNLAWLLRFDFAQLTATGQFLLNSGRNNPTTLTNQDAYVPCPIMGREKRILIDLGLSKRYPLSGHYFLQTDLGATLNNTKVEANNIMVGSQTYNILDIWEGRQPDSGTPGYDYINQGGIGYGGFFSLAAGYELPGAGQAILHYTLYYTRTTLPGYTAFNPHNLIGLRFELANFSFFK